MNLRGGYCGQEGGHGVIQGEGVGVATTERQLWCKCNTKGGGLR